MGLGLEICHIFILAYIVAFSSEFHEHITHIFEDKAL